MPDLGQKGGRFNAKPVADLGEFLDGDVLFPSLDDAQVGPMNIAAPGKLILAQTCFNAETPNGRAEFSGKYLRFLRLLLLSPHRSVIIPARQIYRD
jgi:hypothetical protein